MSGAPSIEPIGEKTIRHHVVERLKRMIVEGEFQPSHRLTETQLATSLGISRAPLREAVRELVDAGLMVSKPYKGLFVRSVTSKDLEEIFSLRTAFEQLAFRELWDKRTPEECNNLRQLNATLMKTVDAGTDPALAIQNELDLHSWCYHLSGHRLLLESWERMKPNLHFYFTLHQRAHGRAGPLREAHDVYVDLACGDDLDAMLAHLEEHMRQGLEATKSFIIERGEDAGGTG